MVADCVRQVVVLDSMGLYGVVLEFAWVDSVLVVLDEWLSYRGGRLNRFDFKCFLTPW